MISRDVLKAQRELYVKGREQAVASISAFNGAIEALDDLLRLCDEYDAAQDKTHSDAAYMTAVDPKENNDA